MVQFYKEGTKKYNIHILQATKVATSLDFGLSKNIHSLDPCYGGG